MGSIHVTAGIYDCCMLNSLCSCPVADARSVFPQSCNDSAVVTTYRIGVHLRCAETYSPSEHSKHTRTEPLRTERRSCIEPCRQRSRLWVTVCDCKWGLRLPLMCSRKASATLRCSAMCPKAREDVSIVSQHFDPRAASHFSPVIKAWQGLPESA